MIEYMGWMIACHKIGEIWIASTNKEGVPNIEGADKFAAIAAMKDAIALN